MSQPSVQSLIPSSAGGWRLEAGASEASLFLVWPQPPAASRQPKRGAR